MPLPKGAINEEPIGGGIIKPVPVDETWATVKPVFEPKEINDDALPEISIARKIVVSEVVGEEVVTEDVPFILSMACPQCGLQIFIRKDPTKLSNTRVAGNCSCGSTFEDHKEAALTKMIADYRIEPIKEVPIEIKPR